jgi:glucose dehydrogenase
MSLTEDTVRLRVDKGKNLSSFVNFVVFVVSAGIRGEANVIRVKAVIAPGLVLILIVATAIAVRSQGRQGEWRYFGGDKAFTRYSPLDQINRDNIRNLHVVWRRPAVDRACTTPSH